MTDRIEQKIKLENYARNDILRPLPCKYTRLSCFILPLSSDFILPRLILLFNIAPTCID